MAKSKANLYPEREQMTALFMKALSYPARLQIVEQLAQEGTCTVSELKKFHRLSYPTLSQHLKILEDAGLAMSYEKFPYTYYSIILPNLIKAQIFIAEFFKRNSLAKSLIEPPNPQ